MKTKQKFNFNTKIHLACSDHMLRPSLNYVYFINGFMYASDAHILVKQSLKLHDIFESDFLNGKSINKNTYANILKYQFANATENGIECSMRDNKDVVLFKYSENEMTMPDFESILNFKYESVLSIKFNYIKLKRLIDSMYLPEGNIIMTFNSENKAIKITAIGVDENLQVALLMPICRETI
jgi:hypothetical protein